MKFGIKLDIKFGTIKHHLRIIREMASGARVTAIINTHMLWPHDMFEVTELCHRAEN